MRYNKTMKLKPKVLEFISDQCITYVFIFDAKCFNTVIVCNDHKVYTLMLIGQTNEHQ